MPNDTSTSDIGFFPLTQEELHSILSTALSRGGEYADIFLEDTRISSLELQDDTVSQAQQVMLYGAGIRVVQGTQTGYAYTMDLSLEAMKQIHLCLSLTL